MEEHFEFCTLSWWVYEKLNSYQFGGFWATLEVPISLPHSKRGKFQHSEFLSIPNPSFRPEYADGQRSSVGHGHVHHESWIRPSEQRASDATSIPCEKSGRICGENEASTWCMECINQNRILTEVIEVNCRIWCTKPCFWTLPDLNFKL